MEVQTFMFILDLYFVYILYITFQYKDALVISSTIYFNDILTFNILYLCKLTFLLLRKLSFFVMKIDQ